MIHISQLLVQSYVSYSKHNRFDGVSSTAKICHFYSLQLQDRRVATLAQELVAVLTNLKKKSLGGLKENHFCPNLLQPTLPSAANTARMFTSYYYTSLFPL
jgi:hypothetical protein